MFEPKKKKEKHDIVIPSYYLPNSYRNVSKCLPKAKSTQFLFLRFITYVTFKRYIRKT